MIHVGTGTCEIGPGATVGHLCMIHHCTIGADALIGHSATVLDGAVVGARAMVAAGATVTPGAEVTPVGPSGEGWDRGGFRSVVMSGKLRRNVVLASSRCRAGATTVGGLPVVSARCAIAVRTSSSVGRAGWRVTRSPGCGG